MRCGLSTSPNEIGPRLAAQSSRKEKEQLLDSTLTLESHRIGCDVDVCFPHTSLTSPRRYGSTEPSITLPRGNGNRAKSRTSLALDPTFGPLTLFTVRLVSVTFGFGLTVLLFPVPFAPPSPFPFPFPFPFSSETAEYSPRTASRSSGEETVPAVE